MRVHSADRTVLEQVAFKSFTTFAMASSGSPSLVLFRISRRMSHSSPVTSSPSNARTAKSPGMSRVMLELSSDPVPWSALQDKASGFPMLFPGRWCRTKSKRARSKDQRACLQLSFLAVRKYSRFLWLVQTSNLSSEPSRKCLHSSMARMMANISLSWIS